MRQNITVIYIHFLKFGHVLHNNYYDVKIEVPQYQNTCTHTALLGENSTPLDNVHTPKAAGTKHLDANLPG